MCSHFACTGTALYAQRDTTFEIIGHIAVLLLGQLLLVCPISSR